MTLSAERQDPPQDVAFTVMRKIIGGWVAQAMATAARLGVADHLVDGPRTAEELAPLVEANPRALHRLLRALSSEGFFETLADGRFGLTDQGRLLVSEAPGSLRDMLLWLVSGLNWRTWAHLTDAVRSGETVFPTVNGFPIFEYFAQHANAADAQIFQRAMTNFSRQESLALAESCDLSGVTHIVDVGGGHGALLASLLKACPSARGTLYDLEKVVADAAVDPALQSRWTTEAGSFFDGVPAGGDLYTLKHIVHDWDDARALAILRNVRAAIAPEGRLVIMEMVIPPDDAFYFGKWLDLEMLVMTPGGQERTADEYRQLLHDGGFTLKRIIPTHGPMNVLEAVPRG